MENTWKIMTAVTAVSIACMPLTAYADDYGFEANGVLIENALQYTVTENFYAESPELQVDFSVKVPYSVEELEEETVQLLTIEWNSTVCTPRLLFENNAEFPSDLTEQPDGQCTKTIYYNLDIDGILDENDNFSFPFVLFGDVPETEVRINGKSFTIENPNRKDVQEESTVWAEDTIQTAPVPVATVSPETEPVKQTEVTTISVLETTSVKATSLTTETTVTSTALQTTSSETVTETTVVMTVPETAEMTEIHEKPVAVGLANPVPKPTRETAVTEEYVADIAEETNHVVQVSQKQEVPETTEEEKQDFPVAFLIAGNILAVIIGLIAKIKFF